MSKAPATMDKMWPRYLISCLEVRRKDLAFLKHLTSFLISTKYFFHPLSSLDKTCLLADGLAATVCKAVDPIVRAHIEVEDRISQAALTEHQ